MFAFSGSCGVASAGGESFVDPFDEIGSRNQSPSSTRKKASSSPSSAGSSPSITRHAVASSGPSQPPPEVTSPGGGGYYVVAAPGPPPPGAQVVYLASPPPMGQAYQQQPQQPMAAAPPRHQQQQQAPYVYYPHPPPQGVVAGHPPAFVPVGAGPAGAPAGSSKKHKIKKGFKKLSLSSRRESQHPPEYHHSRQQQPPFQQPQPHPQPRRAFSGASSFDAARSGGHGKTQQQDNAGIVLYKPAPAFCARFSLPSNCSDNVLFEGTCCAVSGSIVLDGMCYVTTNFFCFSCNFEGQTIAIKIAHSDIESLRRAYAKEYVLRRHKLPTIQREPPPCTHKHFNTLQMVTRSDNVLHTFFNFQSRKHYDALISTITERCPKAYTMNVKKPLEGDEHDRYEERYEETREKEKERNYDSSSEEEDSSDEAKEKGGKRSSSSSSTYHPPAALHEDKGLLDVY